MATLAKRAAEYKIGLALAGVLALAALLRVHDLGEESLWVDELASLWFSDPAHFSRVWQDFHPPGYYIVLHVVQTSLGDSEWLLRLPSAVFGLFSVWAMYLLGRRIYSSFEGLVAALLTAVLHAPIYYSQDARPYSMLLMLSVLTAFFWVGLARDLRSRRPFKVGDVTGYVLSSAACVYTHHFGLLLFGLQGLALVGLALGRGGARNVYRVSLLLLPIIISYLPYLPVFFERLFAGEDSHSFLGEAPSPGAAVKRYAGMLFNESPVMVSVVGVSYGALALGSLLFVRARGYGAASLASAPGVWLALWLTVPLAVVYAVSLLWVPIFIPRSLIICAPAAYLLLARVFGYLGKKLERRSRKVTGITACCVVTLFLAQLVLGADYYSEHQKQEYRQAIAYVSEHTTPDTLLASCRTFRYTENYYLDAQGHEKRFRQRMCFEPQVREISRIVEARDKSRVIFLWAREQPNQRLLEVAEREFDLVRERGFKDMRVYIFERTAKENGSAPLTRQRQGG